MDPLFPLPPGYIVKQKTKSPIATYQFIRLRPPLTEGKPTIDLALACQQAHSDASELGAAPEQFSAATANQEFFIHVTPST